MNPITTLLNAVRGGSRTGPGAEPLSPSFAPPPTGSSRQPAGIGAPSRIPLTPAQLAEMTTTVIPAPPNPNNPATKPHWRGRFLDSAKARKIVEAEAGKLITEDELDLANRFQATYETLQSAILEYGTDAVIRQFKQQRTDISQLAADGSEDAIAQIRSKDRWTRDELLEEAQQKRSQLKRARRNISQKAAELAKVVAARVSKAAAKVMAKMEEKERAVAEEFGCALEPSGALQCVAQMTWRPVQDVEQGSTNSPASIFATFGIMLKTAGVVLYASESEKLVDQIKANEAERQAAEKARAEERDAEEKAQNKQFIIDKAKDDLTAFEAVEAKKIPQQLRDVAAGDLSSIKGLE